MDNRTRIELPENRIIRKRIAARTIGIHLSALPPELQALKDITKSVYLTKQDLPAQVNLILPDGEKALLSRDEAWQFADEAGSKLEWEILPDTLGGKATALLSSTGQGAYADYGRPCVDFAGFAHDSIVSSGREAKNAIASKGLNSVMLGPLFIAIDTTSAAGFAALGHVTRGARLTDKAVLSDVISTGAFEGSSAWASAKFGVFTGVKMMGLAALLPVPCLAIIPISFMAGLTTVVATKRLANQSKDMVVDAAMRPIRQSKASDGRVPPPRVRQW